MAKPVKFANLSPRAQRILGEIHARKAAAKKAKGKRGSKGGGS